MMHTEPLAEPLPTADADADSFRYYPAFDAAEVSPGAAPAADRRKSTACSC
jgi:hypothetical protein